MDWRKRRQLTIFTIVLVVGGLIGTYIYEVNKTAPTCFDQTQNGNEEGVDCGGSCISCKLLQVQDAQIVWSRFFKTREGSYDAAAFVVNPNIYFGALAMEYQFELLDVSGASIATRKGTTFLLPSERTTIVEPDLRTDLTAASVVFKIISVGWGRVYEPTPRYDLGLTKRDYQVITNPQGVSQSAVQTAVFNNTAETFSRAYVSILLYDENKNVIAVNKTIVENLQPNETRPVSFVWPNVVPTPVSIEGEVRVNSFIR